MCPRCGTVFGQSGTGGCFTTLWSPMNCPGENCTFPWPPATDDKRGQGMGPRDKNEDESFDEALWEIQTELAEIKMVFDWPVRYPDPGEQ